MAEEITIDEKISKMYTNSKCSYCVLKLNFKKYNPDNPFFDITFNKGVDGHPKTQICQFPEGVKTINDREAYLKKFKDMLYIELIDLSIKYDNELKERLKGIETKCLTQ
jgi:hypothetical protein